MKTIVLAAVLVALTVPAWAYDAYITFKGINAGPVDGFYQTQAAANAAAADNADIVAHVGVLDVGDLTPNEAYFDGTDVLPDNAEEDAYFAGLTEEQKLKNGATALHDALVNLEARLDTDSALVSR